MNISNNNIDFMKNPWRGVFTEVAKKMNQTPQGVLKGYKRNSLIHVELVNQEINRRARIMREKERLEAEYAA